jgi:hypothetical protein
MPEDGVSDGVVGYAEVRENPRPDALVLLEDAEEQMLGPDGPVAHAIGLLAREHDDLHHVLGHPAMCEVRPGPGCNDAIHRGRHGLDGYPELDKNLPGREPFARQSEEELGGSNLTVLEPPHDLGRLHQDLAGVVVETLPRGFLRVQDDLRVNSTEPKGTPLEPLLGLLKPRPRGGHRRRRHSDRTPLPPIRARSPVFFLVQAQNQSVERATDSAQIIIGVVLILGGTLVLWFRRPLTRMWTRFYARQATALPWLYPGPMRKTIQESWVRWYVVIVGALWIAFGVAAVLAGLYGG